MTWEKGRQLKSIGDNTFTYNANGIRTSKYVKSTDSVHHYTLDGTKILREEWTEHFTSMGEVVTSPLYYIEPIYDNEDSVTGINFCGNVYFFRKNLQGDIIEIVESYAGRTVAKYSYDAWGKCTIDSDSIDTVIATRNPFRYRGYYYDQETDLYYLQSRYYDANVGRFVNGDEVKLLGVGNDLLSYNLMTYCKNSPTHYTDHTGRWAIFIGLSASVALFLVGLSGMLGFLFDGKGNVGFMVSGTYTVVGIAIAAGICFGLYWGYKTITDFYKSDLGTISIPFLDLLMTRKGINGKIKGLQISIGYGLSYTISVNSKSKLWKTKWSNIGKKILSIFTTSSKINAAKKITIKILKR